MAAVTQLGYLGLGVNDADEWEQFATRVLGLQVGDRDPDGSLFLRMDENHHRFTLHPNGRDDLDYVGWEVADKQGMEEVAGQLASAGVEVYAGTREEAASRRVLDLIKFEDPSGIATEVCYGPQMSFEKPFQPSRPITGFKTGTMGLGHILIAVRSFDETLQFYGDVLGMRVSDFIELATPDGTKIKAGFFHCNSRHHSLAFVEAPMPKRIHHIMMEAKSVDDVGATLYLCRETGVPIETDLGRHSNDHMFSFYMRNPSGFQVEYGWGGRVIDESTWRVESHNVGSVWGHPGLLGASAPFY